MPIYLVQAEHPESGSVLEENYVGIPAVIARAVELLREGYTVEIRSDSSVATLSLPRVTNQ